jgi:hypothetical protein
MTICGDLMIENAIYVAGDNVYLWTLQTLKPIIGGHGELSAEWHGETLTLASLPADSVIDVLVRHQ